MKDGEDIMTEQIDLIQEAAELLWSPDDERIKYIKTDKFIMYPKAESILLKMEDLLNEPKKSRMPCLLIIGDSHNGKTSLIKKFERLHLPTDGREEPTISIVFVQAPITPDPNGFYDAILDTILIPHRKGDSYTKKASEIKYHFESMGVKVLIVDEIHNILSGSASKQRAFMNAVKNISNALMLPIVLVGIKEALNATSTDMQISSRFRPMLLPLWRLNADYASLLASIETMLPLRKLSKISTNSKIGRTILELSEGLIGEIVSVISEAAIFGIRSGSEKITEDVIKECGFIRPSLRRGLALIDV
ncbi:MAG: TniB family NTP-binding protein [Dissulfurispiraceae bacterium]